MSVKLIEGKFYVVGSKKNIYRLNKDLECECIGYFRWKKCRHQDEVIKEIEKGKFVDITIIPTQKI